MEEGHQPLLHLLQLLPLLLLLALRQPRLDQELVRQLDRELARPHVPALVRRRGQVVPRLLLAQAGPDLAFQPAQAVRGPLVELVHHAAIQSWAVRACGSVSVCQWVVGWTLVCEHESMDGSMRASTSEEIRTHTRLGRPMEPGNCPSSDSSQSRSK